MSAMGKIEAERALSPAEAMGIRIGNTVVKTDWFIWTASRRNGIAKVYERKNRITLSAGDAELDVDLWQAIHRDGINAAHAECFARVS